MSGLPERFARHARIPGWKQEPLEAATVVVVGVGALGNAVAQALALAGVGRLILCDPDVVSESNLSRAPLFRPSDVGRAKVFAARAALAVIAPAASVEARPLPLVNGVGLAELRDASVTVGCLDSRAARLELAGRAALVRARWIDGGTAAWSGEVRPYLDPDGPCYGCALSPEERAVRDSPWSCADAGRGPRAVVEEGASAPIAALVGAWMSTMAVRAIMGSPQDDRGVIIDTARGVAEPLRIDRAADCPLHMPLGEPLPIALDHGAAVGDLRARLGPSRRALAWSPILCRLACPRGHYTEERWGRPEVRPCPSCGTLMRPRTTLELDRAPEGARLSDLGVAPGEILPVRAGETMACAELCG